MGRDEEVGTWRLFRIPGQPPGSGSTRDGLAVRNSPSQAISYTCLPLPSDYSTMYARRLYGIHGTRRANIFGVLQVVLMPPLLTYDSREIYPGLFCSLTTPKRLNNLTVWPVRYQPNTEYGYPDRSAMATHMAQLRKQEPRKLLHIRTPSSSPL